VLQIPDTVDTVVYAPDDGWWYHPKDVEQLPDKINCATLHLVGYILKYQNLRVIPKGYPAVIVMSPAACLNT
jgi:hypothetical protein